MDQKTLDELVRNTRALVLLQLQTLTPVEERLKPEVILARSGFGAREAADMLGKSQAAVAKAMQRGKAA
jgi:DNA-directed RNA polymerase specialized sigma24 family protein